MPYVCNHRHNRTYEIIIPHILLLTCALRLTTHASPTPTHTPTPTPHSNAHSYFCVPLHLLLTHTHSLTHSLTHSSPHSNPSPGTGSLPPRSTTLKKRLKMIPNKYDNSHPDCLDIHVATHLATTFMSSPRYINVITSSCVSYPKRYSILST